MPISRHFTRKADQRLVLTGLFAAFTLIAAQHLMVSPAHSAERLTPRPSSLNEESIRRNGVADDEVMLELAAEKWVETETAKVRLVADLAVQSGGYVGARTDLLTKLKDFSGSAKWRIVEFNRLAEEAGFERWQLVAEARVQESELSPLGEKVKSATRPGLSLRIGNVDFTPTEAERREALAELRREIYAKAAAEVKALNSIFTDRHYRVRLINFTSHMRPASQMDHVSAKRAQAPMLLEVTQGIAGAMKLAISSRVHLAAEVVPN
jgi:hypothetical protein